MSAPPPPGQPPYGPPPGQPPAGPPPGQPPPGYGPPQQPFGGYGPKPDNYLVWAILSTLLCCLPAGIVSIVYSSKVDGLYNSGQLLEAQQASENAKRWAIIAVIAGLVVGALWGVLVALGGFSASVY